MSKSQLKQQDLEQQAIQQAYDYSQCIKDKIQPYFKYEGTVPKTEEHMGQLKFYKDNLIIRNLALSTGIRVLNPKETVFKYLDERILQVASNPQQTIDFFDKKKNIEAYLKSVYHTYNIWQDELVEKVYTTDCFSRFLLLERIKQVIEEEFLTYINTPQKTKKELQLEKEKREEEKRRKAAGESPQSKKTLPPTQKQRNYIPFLHSVAIYEILMWEYFEEFFGKFSQEESDNQLEEDFSQHYMDNAEKFYLITHLANLFAILRIVYTIEEVQCNTRLEDEKDAKGKIGEYASDRANEFRKNLEKIGLFCAKEDVHRGKDRNRDKLFKPLNVITFENHNEGTRAGVRINIKEYVNYIKNKNNSKPLNARQEKENFEKWLNMVSYLSGTFGLKTTSDIFDIYSNVKLKQNKEE